MDTYSWQSFLMQWSKEVLNSDYYRNKLPPEVVNSGWLGYPGATEERILSAESRLHTRLPSSYRDFIKVTNGWRLVGSFIYNIWPLEQIEWLFVGNQSFIDNWIKQESRISQSAPVLDDEYFVYGDGQESTAIRGAYLQSALQISDWENSAIFLLNPEVIHEGEWEAWFYANWLPGANRYRSFWEMLKMEYELFHEMRGEGLL